jgi:glycosylphosphatidylinositol transamidase (GPIT) subunit GPI8
MRRTAGYTWTGYKTNTLIAKELKVTLILDKIMEYKKKWIIIIIIIIITIIIIIIIILLAFTTHLRLFSLLSLEVSRSHTMTQHSR